MINLILVYGINVLQFDLNCVHRITSSVILLRRISEDNRTHKRQ